MKFLVEFFDAALKLPEKELRSRNIGDRPIEMALIAKIISPEEIAEWAKKEIRVRRTLSISSKKEIVKLLIEVTNGRRHLIELSREEKTGTTRMSFRVDGREYGLPVTMISESSRIIKEVVEGMFAAA